MIQSNKGTLLIVDGEPLKRTTLDIELTAAGYRVLSASDVAAALVHLEAQPIDVVVSDLHMSEMDGLYLLDQIKVRWPQTHVIFMTAYSSVDSAVQAIKRGAYDYVSKPVSADALLAKLEHLRSGDGHAGAEQSPATNDKSDQSEVLCGISLKLPEALAGVERSLIDAALRRAAGNQAKAAQFLGIPRTTLRDKLTKYGLAAESGQH